MYDITEELRKVSADLMSARNRLDVMLEARGLPPLPSEISETNHLIRKALETLTTEKVLDWTDTLK